MAKSAQTSDPMKFAGFLLLTMGWALVVAAVMLLNQKAALAGFVLAGTGVEILGLVLVARTFIAPKPERR